MGKLVAQGSLPRGLATLTQGIGKDAVDWKSLKKLQKSPLVHQKSM